MLPTVKFIEMSKLDKELKDYKTMCCNDGVYVKSRAIIKCKACDKDVTLESVFLFKQLMN